MGRGSWLETRKSGLRWGWGTSFFEEATLLPDWRLGGANRAQQSEETGRTGLLILTGTRDAVSDESHTTNEETMAQSEAGLLAHEVPH